MDVMIEPDTDIRLPRVHELDLQKPVVGLTSPQSPSWAHHFGLDDVETYTFKNAAATEGRCFVYGKYAYRDDALKHQQFRTHRRHYDKQSGEKESFAEG